MKPVVLFLLALACSAQVEREPTETEPECNGLTRLDVPAGYCVRLVPKHDGPPIAYGPTCTELVTPDPSNAICAAWVTLEEQRVWVGEAIVSFEAWSGDERWCSCL